MFGCVIQGSIVGAGGGGQSRGVAYWHVGPGINWVVPSDEVRTVVGDIILAPGGTITLQVGAKIQIINGGLVNTGGTLVDNGGSIEQVTFQEL